MSENTSSDLALEVDSLFKWYGKKPALQDLSLEVRHGGIHAVVGRNGAGKSTLFRILLGFARPSAGRSRILGADSQSLSASMRSEIAVVDEEHALPSWLSAEQLRAMQRDHHPRWNQSVYDDVLDLFDLSPHQEVGRLSRGERAGLNLALALAQSPRLLILDEPTLGLDPEERHRFHDFLVEVGEHVVVVLSTHIVDDVRQLCAHMAILHEGCVRATGEPEQLIEALSGRVWHRTVPRQQVASYQASFDVLSTRLQAGRTQVRILADDRPEPGFTSMQPELEDVYFSVLHGAPA